MKNVLDASGDISMIQSKRNENFGFHNYAKHFTYNAAGAVTSMHLGNGLWETAQFNSRLQSTQLGLGILSTGANLWKVDYEFGELQPNGTVDAVKNSGNIARQTLTVPGMSFVQSYTYDSLYRLSEAVEKTGTTTNWSQQFGYDRYGNRTSFVQDIGGIAKNTTPAVDANTNRFTSTEFAYDANGNIVGDIDEVTNLPRQFIFNGDNKQTEVKRDGVTIGRYYYDGEGRRVKKVTDTETTVFIYAAGQLIAEYSTAISQTPSVSYTTADHLGSPRVITNELGQVSSRRDFMPFGEELYAGVGNRTGDAGLKYSSAEDDIRQKFTGYQKDNETNLDFAEARMYANNFGRFTAIDPILIKKDRLIDPQRLNLYLYVRQNPLTYKDSNGEDLVLATKNEAEQKTIREALTKVAETKSGREFLQKLEDSKVTYNLSVNDAIKMRDGTPAFGRNKLEEDGTVTIQINTKQIEAANKENAPVQKINDNLLGAAPPKPLPVPDAPQGKTAADRNAVVIVNELIQGSNTAEEGDRSNQTATETRVSIPQAYTIVRDKEKAKGEKATAFVENILKPKEQQ